MGFKMYFLVSVWVQGVSKTIWHKLCLVITFLWEGLVYICVTLYTYYIIKYKVKDLYKLILIRSDCHRLSASPELWSVGTSKLMDVRMTGERMLLARPRSSTSSIWPGKLSLSCHQAVTAVIKHLTRALGNTDLRLTPNSFKEEEHLARQEDT